MAAPSKELPEKPFRKKYTYAPAQRRTFWLCICSDILGEARAFMAMGKKDKRKQPRYIARYRLNEVNARQVYFKAFAPRPNDTDVVLRAATGCRK
jgi:hypothetical protein